MTGKQRHKEHINAAKNYLGEYAQIAAALDQRDQEILEILTKQALAYDIREYRELQEILDEATRDADRLSREASARLRAIADIGYGRHMDILIALYIEGASVRTVADLMMKDERRVRELRDRALARIRLPE